MISDNIKFGNYVIIEDGVYVGSPSKKIKDIIGKMNGVPEDKKTNKQLIQDKW